MDSGQAASPLRVGLVQFKPFKGDISRNVARVRALVSEGADRADILVFPEAALSGYFLEGGVGETALAAEELVVLLGPPPRNAPDVVLGFYERRNRRIHNSGIYLEPRGSAWGARHIHRKIFLPTYGVFDERRFVDPGDVVEAFDTRFGRFGLLICEDAWHSMPGTILAIDGAELLMVLSASPSRGFEPRAGGRPANLARWDRLAPDMALEHGIFVAVSQLAGSEGGKLFPGGSLAVGPAGEELARGPLFEEAITLALMDGAAIERARTATPLLADLAQALPHLERSLGKARARPRQQDETDRARDGVGPEAESGSPADAPTGPPMIGRLWTEGPRARERAALEDLTLDLDLVERTLIEFIREEVGRRRGFRRIVIGVSGGVDSAVSLVLACRALGPEHVHGFRLPYRTSSPDSLEHAALALDTAGAHASTIDISEPIDRYVDRYEPELSPLRKGNLMARLRSVILFDQAAKIDALPLGTGNKSERLLGYFTWHADDAPPINPLGDLFKSQVWALARHLGVPDVIVDKPASADLVQGVHDEDELGVSYHLADPILNGLLGGFRAEDLLAMGFDRSAVEVVDRRLRSTHWKRELPTVAVLSSSAIGEFYLRPVDY